MDTEILNSNGSIDSTHNYTNNSSETVLDLNYRYAHTLLPLTVIFGLIAVIGVIGNGAVIVVYGKGGIFKDRNFRWYVVCLGIIDLATCIIVIPLEMLKHRRYFSFEEDSLCKTKCFVNVFAASSTSCCLLVVAIDRYLQVCHPLVARFKVRQITPRLAQKLCTLVIFLGLLISVPAAIMCGAREIPMKNRHNVEIEVYLCEAAQEYINAKVRYIYRFTLFIFQIMISIILIALYTRICCKMRNRWKESRKRKIELIHLSHQSRDSSITQNVPTNVKLLGLVTIVYIITYMFYLLLSFVDITSLNPLEFVFFSLVYRSYFVQSVINPFLCVKMDYQFRKSIASLKLFPKF
ncbi:hypothetical protein CHS0354_036444 [Potamilus streckersoni]|uniref:G-protein coupled receptors family 1 profile domain-containing protein n=1 Tax=Potamilus streckersoni TaxID=2493646 RepID=A0AAE0SXE9_9BIVA|nr:hypothetical protein CHS0354_036444 [Potamilus streckersoni]